MDRTSHQTGSMGLHYVCYRLAQQCWHVTTVKRKASSPTEGVCWRGKMTPITFRTNSFSQTAAVPFGQRGRLGMVKDFLIVVIELNSGSPCCYILTRAEAQDAMSEDGNGEWWLEIEDYDTEEFKERWDKFENHLAMYG